MEKKLTCIVCPMGCSLCVKEENGKVTVTGNTCPRGAAYGESEIKNPTRTVTSTMRTEGGKLVPVKTDRAIPKDKIFECMKIINENKAPLQNAIGDVIIKDVFGSNIVVTGKEVI